MIYNVGCLKQNEQSYNVTGKSTRTKVKASETSVHQWSHTDRIQWKKIVSLQGIQCDVLLSITLVIHSLSRIRFFATPWTAARQASLFFTNSQSLLKLVSTGPMMPSNHLILCHLLLLLPSIFPRIRVFSNESALASGSQSTGASAVASVIPRNIQGWFPLGLICLIWLLSKVLSRVFSSITFRMHQFFSTQPSLWSNSHIHTWLLEKP